MILQLPVISLIIFGLGIWFWIKKKKPLAITFWAIGIMGILLFLIVWHLFPAKVPF
ncbi:MAG: hypothetical protein ACOYN5_14290 [Bacteroidales bacterium]